MKITMAIYKQNNNFKEREAKKMENSNAEIIITEFLSTSS